MEKVRNFVVLGGGISGLSVAYYLQTALNVLQRKRGLSKDHKITVLERSQRTGGWIQSTTLSSGAIFEHGPRSLRPGGVGEFSLDFVKNLGLSDQVLPVLASHPGSRNRFIYADGHLHTLPNSLGGLFKKQSLFSQRLITTVLKEIFKRKNCVEDESIHSFVSRRFSTEIADYFVDALCIGIFAADCRKLSVRSCFPIMFDAEKSHGSVVLANLLPSKKTDSTTDLQENILVERSQKERWMMWSLKGGLQLLPDKIHQTLNEEGVDVLTSTSCSSLHFDKAISGKMVANVVTCGGNTIEADHVFSAIPSQSLASLLPASYSPLANELSLIDSVDVAVVNLEYQGCVLKKKGFGYLIPSNQKCKVLGVIFDSCSFPGNDSQESTSTRLTCMMGGSWFQEHFGDTHTVDHDQLLALAKETVKEHLGIFGEPENTAVRVHQQCIPSYAPGHFKILENLESYIDTNSLPISLLGSSYHGVSVNDCIHNAHKAANQIINSI